MTRCIFSTSKGLLYLVFKILRTCAASRSLIQESPILESSYDVPYPPLFLFLKPLNISIPRERLDRCPLPGQRSRVSKVRHPLLRPRMHPRAPLCRYRYGVYLSKEAGRRARRAAP
ncbi:hypothetical protein BJY52DRAFT_713584 [Lactarius psammicola]|nr:hypothetical protein BJY52DRAFT_713584 [Lactarius psammicola]